MEKIHLNSKLQCIGKQIYQFDSVTSTNDILLKLIQESKTSDQNRIPEGTIVLAEEQTAGRGRFNRTWQSSKGKGLWLSIYLAPRFLELPKAFLVTFCAATAVAQVVKDLFQLSPQIKWPNDVLLKGSKFCGILTDTKSEKNLLAQAILGIGINVNQNQDEFNEEAGVNATSLRIEHGEDIDRMKLLQRIIEKLDANYTLLKLKKFKDMLEDWKKFATFLGQSVTLIDGRMKKVGIATDIDENGGLILNCNGKEQIFYNGSLVL
ncbi:biotin--[acetyl-CoA-carboxylase] ligase [candidate division KSB1 bacterium]|nr:biotin--[acetyl-CoA-carboxylase] ligase [candidate division KSB1 bacterium]